MKKLNLVGRRVARLRYERDMTQDELADVLERIGWSMTRSGVSKLEGGTIYVPDFRLFYLAQAFRIQITDLLPNIDLLAPVHETILRFIRNEKRGFVPELITPTSCDLMKSLARRTRL